ncbi:MAG: DNA methyltransferase, partial [Chitinophagia bacterium]|nr:DNA methyltransferase [Chitinophagia bacterium]
TGYKPAQSATQRDQRFKIFLTNSLEEANPDQTVPLLAFMRELTIEGLEASKVKNETPVMVILGNPPYSGESQNKSKWIMKLMEDYKKEPNSTQKLAEKNPKWINDDYVKFLRFGQYFIEKNGEGILAFINSHGFLDNPTFRAVRFSSLKTYDKIYTIDLHGNSKKKEITPTGEKDENVFDIQQGVAINIFVKNGKKKAGDLAQVFHFDCFGKREDKYNFLWENSLSSIVFKTLSNVAPMYFMVPKDFELKKEYEAGFSIAELFLVNSVGIVTAKDAVLVNDKKSDLLKNIEKFYQIKADENLVQKISYRPFDEKFVYYDLKLVERARQKVMKHFLTEENWGLVFSRFQFRKENPYAFCFLTQNLIDINSLQSPGTINVAPLYIYQAQNQQNTNIDDLFFAPKSKPQRVPNFKAEIIQEFAAKLGLNFLPDHQTKLGAITLPLREGQTSEASLGRGQNSNILKELNFASNS